MRSAGWPPRTRLAMARAVADGVPVGRVARWFGCSSATVYRAVRLKLKVQMAVMGDAREKVQ